MKKLFALLLILIGSLNASLAGDSSGDCCAGAQDQSSQMDIDAGHDCSASDQGLCSGCGFLGHCAVALIGATLHAPDLLTAMHDARVPAFNPAYEPDSFLDPPIAEHAG